MSATTKTDNEIATSTTPEVSIPVARIPDTSAPVPAPKKSLKDRMNKMSAAPEKPKAVAGKKPEYDAPKEAVDALARFIPADIIATVAQKRADNAKAEASVIMFKAFVKALFASKVVPGNPKVIIRDGAGQPDMSCIYMVQDRFAPGNMKLPEFKVDDSDETITASIVDTLVEAGVDRDSASTLVANEVSSAKRRGLRSLNELVEGSFGKDKQWVEATVKEQAVAEKLMDFLDTLTPEEQAIIRRDETKIAVKPQFLSRASNYAQSEKGLAAILQIFVPTNSVSHAALGLSDDEATKILKLQQAANEIIGSVQVK